MIAVFLICAAVGALAAVYLARPFYRGRERAVRLAGVASGAVIAVGALGAYLVNGEPDTPGSPYAEMAERLRAADPQSLTAIEQEEVLRAAIRANPRDVRALALLGRYLARTGRELEGVVLLERAIGVDEADAGLWASLGEALVNLNDEVTPQAQRAFARANTLDPGLPAPAFFLGVAAYEAGERNVAAQAWADILARLDPDDPFRQAIAGRAADLLSRPQGGPGSEGAAPFAQAMQDGRLDVGFFSGPAPYSLLLQVENAPGFHLLGFDDAAMDRYMALLPGASAGTVPAGTYAGQDSDVQVPYLTNQLVVSADVPDDLVYEITKVLIENVGQFQELFAGAEEMRAETALVNNPIEVHPGAARYYEETGITASR